MITKENYYRKLNLKLKPTQKAILDLLVKYSSKDFTCYPTQEYIAKEINMTRETVNRHIKKFEKMKFITIIKNRTNKEQKFDNNIYFLNIFFMGVKSNASYINNILKNSYKYIESKIFKQLEEIKGQNFDNFYDLEKEKDFDFNIEEFINNLAESTKLKKINILSTIVNIQDKLKDSHIGNIRNYIVTCFSNAIDEQRIKDKINITANALPTELKENLRLII